MEDDETIKKCPECDNWLVNISTGSVCLRGCGKIYPKVDQVTNARGNGMLIPDAITVSGITQDRSPTSRGHTPTDKGLYSVDGIPGLFVKVKRDKQGMKASHPDSVLAILDDDKVREFVRWDCIDDILSEIGYKVPEPAQAEGESDEEPEDSEPPDNEDPAIQDFDAELENDEDGDTDDDPEDGKEDEYESNTAATE